MTINSKLLKFLDKYPKTENGKHTHIIYAPSPGRSYTIPDDKIDGFYQLIHDSVFINKIVNQKLINDQNYVFHSSLKKNTLV